MKQKARPWPIWVVYLLWACGKHKEWSTFDPWVNPVTQLTMAFSSSLVCCWSSFRWQQQESEWNTHRVFLCDTILNSKKILISFLVMQTFTHLHGDTRLISAHIMCLHYSRWTKCSQPNGHSKRTFWANAINVSDLMTAETNHSTHSQSRQMRNVLINMGEYCGRITHLCLTCPVPHEDIWIKLATGSKEDPSVSVIVWACVCEDVLGVWTAPQKKYPWLLLNLYQMIRLGLHPRTPLSPSRDSAGSIAANA